MKNTHIALIGNPNSGKSSLFNHLTGLRQKTGNFPGITVDRKKGFLFQNSQIEITDLPGLYNLYPNSKDEAIVLKELFKANQKTGGHPYDGIVYVAEAQHLDRSLLLYSQIADLGIPTLFVINMIDEAQKSGYKIDKKALQNRLGIPIFETNARSGEGVAAVRTALEQNKLFQPNTFFRSRYENAASFATAENQSPYKNWLQQHFTTYLLEGQDQAKNQTPAEKEAIELAVFNDIQSRQQFTHQIAKNIVQLPSETKNQRRTEQIDRWLTHPVFGYAFFLLILYFIFQAIFSWSTWPMDLIDGAFGSLSEWVKGTLGDNLISNLITEGVIPGIGGVVIFIPQIALLFLFIGLLEASGYMARVVFLMDKLMQQFGLNGKSVVPLVSGLACSIPAVMAARTIENPKERLLTILVTPFMTCAARLPVYAIIIAVTIPAVNVLPGVSLQGLTLLGLYLLGTLAALLSAAILNRFITSNHASHLVLEMPIYRMPTWKDVGINIYMKVRSFVWEAGRIIFVISLVLWFLASYGPGDLAQKTNDFETELTQNNTTNMGSDELAKRVQSFQLEHSYAGIMGKTVEPLVAPLGYDWKISIALITSFAAREVFVGTLATIYSIGEEPSDETVVEKLSGEMNYETGKKRFDLATSMSLLVFYVFAMQCMSTLAIVKRETKTWRYPILQFVFMTALAYLAALFTFNIF